MTDLDRNGLEATATVPNHGLNPGDVVTVTGEAGADMFSGLHF